MDLFGGRIMRAIRPTTRTLLCWAVLSLSTAAGIAQDLSPRFYWPAPKGTKVVVLGFSYTYGDVLMDPSLPLDGVDSRTSTGFFAYMQTFSLLGRTANVVVELPYSWGTTEGFLFGLPAQRDFCGLNDLGVTLAVNLLGAPSMTLSEFQALRAIPHPILGASVKVLAPTGHYDEDRLINVGANRWAFRPELGFVIPLRPKWLAEFETGAWFFGDDDEFLPGTREQKPIFSAEVHLVRRFKPGFWASIEANYYIGGQQTIGGDQLVDVQRNARIGGTLVVPFRGRHAIKVGYSNALVTEFGNDFRQFLMSYILVFR
jgi:hypothetical protein